MTGVRGSGCGRVAQRGNDRRGDTARAAAMPCDGTRGGQAADVRAGPLVGGGERDERRGDDAAGDTASDGPVPTRARATFGGNVWTLRGGAMPPSGVTTGDA